MALEVQLNGQTRIFDGLGPGSTLVVLLEHLELKGDRIAVERNGEIVPRADWQGVELKQGDRLEVVHFVGGGASHSTAT